MLWDDLVNHKFENNSETFNSIMDDLSDLCKDCVAMNLTDEVVRAVEYIADHTKPSVFNSRLNLDIKLPHNKVWVEFPYKSRIEAKKEFGTLALAEKSKRHLVFNADIPQRIGFIIEYLSSTEIAAKSIWRFNNGSYNFGRFDLIISLDDSFYSRGVMHLAQAMDREEEVQWLSLHRNSLQEIIALPLLKNKINVAFTKKIDAYMDELSDGDSKLKNQIFETSSFDAASEWRFIAALLLFFNSDMVEVSTIHRDKLRKSRKMKGLETCDYHNVRLRRDVTDIVVD